MFECGFARLNLGAIRIENTNRNRTPQLYACDGRFRRLNPMHVAPAIVIVVLKYFRSFSLFIHGEPVRSVAKGDSEQLAECRSPHEVRANL